MPTYALDLGADISLGGTNVSVGASVGHGSLASASLDVGSTGLDATVGSTGTDPNQAAEGPAGAGPNGALPGETEAERLIRLGYLGRDIRSSDGVFLGRVADLRFVPNACPLLGVVPNPVLAVEHRMVWLSMTSCKDQSGDISIRMNSKSFVSSL